MNYWIWLSTIEDLGSIKKMRLLNKFGTPEKIYKASDKKLLNVDGIDKNLLKKIKASKDEELVNKYENYMKKNNIEIINIFEERYPAKLRLIYAPPIVLFAKGNLELLYKKSIAIIGTREPSLYGVEIAKSFAKSLAQNDICIISGMARGVDSMAHIGALNVSGDTIAVLGCGLDIVYPKENANIYNEICRRGLVISEYIVGVKPDSGNFPLRNRIISGLANGLLVVEAKKQSGTIITTDFALDQGKNIYVVPGNINSPTSEGTNNLIKQGAKLVTNLEDILEDM